MVVHPIVLTTLEAYIENHINPQVFEQHGKYEISPQNQTKPNLTKPKTTIKQVITPKTNKQRIKKILLILESAHITNKMCKAGQVI